MNVHVHILIHEHVLVYKPRSVSLKANYMYCIEQWELPESYLFYVQYDSSAQNTTLHYQCGGRERLHSQVHVLCIYLHVHVHVCEYEYMEIHVFSTLAYENKKGNPPNHYLDIYSKGHLDAQP